MRKLLFFAALVATPALGASEMVMHRDPGCGCCLKWAAQVKAALGRSVKVVDNANRAAIQKRLGITSSLQSCHTAFIYGLAFEWHVPIADVKRVLAAKPKGVSGLAVGGMPLGSPGMEVPGQKPQTYIVYSFGSAGQKIYARH